MERHDQLEVQLRQAPDRLVLRLQGELDLASSGRLQAAIDEADVDAAALVVLDLRELRFIDSTGLRIVLALRERLRTSGVEFAVTPGTEQVQRLLSVTGVAEHLRTIATADALPA